jgi:serine/threonine-protein kinase
MEFVKGETVENHLKRSGRIEVKLALEIATQVAAGLAAVHKQKLVHRDIKPSNIDLRMEALLLFAQFCRSTSAAWSFTLDV